MGTTGPIITNVTGLTSLNGSDYRSSSMMQHKYQSEPRSFVHPLPYTRRLARSNVEFAGSRRHGNNTPADCLNFGARAFLDYRSDGMVARCKQQAYSKLVGQIKEDSMGWGENLATRKQSFEMMLHRIGTLTNAARRLRKGDIPGFCRALGVTQKPSKSKLKNLSSIWLEYHFGWEPLYGDIYTACKTLSSDVPAHTIRGVSMEEASESLPFSESGQRVHARVIVKYQGTYYVDNPNKFLLNKLGVINPVAVAWELVPFSFAVDWFLPIGQYLQSFTDFWGVGRRDEFTTIFREADASVWYAYASKNPDFDYYVKSSACDTYRTLGIDVPKPTFKLFKGFSLVRGATAIALLVGMLRSLG